MGCTTLIVCGPSLVHSRQSLTEHVSITLHGIMMNDVAAFKPQDMRFSLGHQQKDMRNDALALNMRAWHVIPLLNVTKTKLYGQILNDHIKNRNLFLHYPTFALSTYSPEIPRATAIINCQALAWVNKWKIMTKGILKESYLGGWRRIPQLNN